jgi:hypothetical protein
MLRKLILAVAILAMAAVPVPALARGGGHGGVHGGFHGGHEFHVGHQFHGGHEHFPGRGFYPYPYYGCPYGVYAPPCY